MTKVFRKYLSIALCFLIMLTTVVPVTAGFAENNKVIDYENHWAKKSIEEVMKKGIIKGYPDGTFKPDNSITRAEFFTIINKAFSFSDTSNNNYVDVPNDKWYANEVSKAVAAGYISPYEDGTIEPEREIRREEVADIVAKIKNLQRSSTTNNFTDLEGSEYSESINKVFDSGIIKGYPDGTFKPKEKITRAEAVMVLLNSINYKNSKIITYSKAGTYGSESEIETIDNDVLVNVSGVKLRNMIIKGNLTVAKEVGEGDATLENVIVEGETYIYGGGSNSIHFIDSVIGEMYVEKSGSAVRIVASGKTDVEKVIVKSEIKLEEGTLTSTGFDDILVEGNKEKIMVTLIDTVCSKMEVKSEGAILNTTAASKISSLNIKGENIKVIGKGKITSAEVKANGATFDSKPKNMLVDKGIKTPTIKIIETKSSGGSSSGGSGGGSGGGSKSSSSSSNRVTGVALSKEEITLLAGGSSETVIATIEPSNASNKVVSWSTNNSDVATVSGGVITPIATGVAVITVITDDENREDSVIVRVVDEIEVNSANNLENALKASDVKKIKLTSDITGNINVERSGETNFELDFSEYSLTGSLNIVANEVSVLTFNGKSTESIVGDFTVEAERGTVNNNINVNGKIDIMAISDHTWNQNGDAKGINIMAEGGSFAYASGNLGDGIVVKPNSAKKSIILDGDLSLIPLNIEKPVKLEIKKTATPPEIKIKEGAGGTEIDNLSEKEAKVTAEVEAFVSGKMKDMGGKASVKKKLNKPVFSVESGEISKGTEVQIISEDADSIFYTLDGTDPAQSETGSTKRYQAKIVVNESLTIKAIAVKDGCRGSKIAKADYVVTNTIKIKSMEVSKYPDIDECRVGDKLTIDNVIVSDGKSTEGRIEYFVVVLETEESTEGIGEIKIDGNSNELIIPETYDSYEHGERSLIGKYIDFGAMIKGTANSGHAELFGPVVARIEPGEIPEVSSVTESKINNVDIIIDFKSKYGVDKETAEDISNYFIEGLEIMSARAVYTSSLGNDYYNRVILTTSERKTNQTYYLHILKMRDGSKDKVLNDNIPYERFRSRKRDDDAPTISAVIEKNLTEFDVIFSEENSLDLDTALDISNYGFENDELTVLSAKLADEGQFENNYYDLDDPFHSYESGKISVTLTVSPMEEGKEYKLLVDNISDNFGNVMVIQNQEKVTGPAKIDRPSTIEFIDTFGPNNLIFKFDEPVKKEDAENISNYSISGGIGEPISVELGNDYKLAMMKVPELYDGTLYEITLNDIDNFWGYRMEGYKKEIYVDFSGPEIEEVKIINNKRIEVYFNEKLSDPGRFGINDLSNDESIRPSAKLSENGYSVIIELSDEDALQLEHTFELTMLRAPEDLTGNDFENYTDYQYNFDFEDRIFGVRILRPNKISAERFDSENPYTDEDLGKTIFVNPEVDEYAKANSCIEDGNIVIELNPQFSVTEDDQYTITIDDVESYKFKGSMETETIESTTGAGTTTFTVESSSLKYDSDYAYGAGFVTTNGTNTPATELTVTNSEADDYTYYVTETTFEEGDKFVIYVYVDDFDGTEGNEFNVGVDRVEYISPIIEVK